MKKKIRLILILSVCLLGAGIIFYFKYAAPTRVAMFNFPDFTVEKIIRSNNNKWVKIASIDMNKSEEIQNYDMVLVRIHGNSIKQKHADEIKKAIEQGIAVINTEKDNFEYSSFSGREYEYLYTLLGNGCVKNYRSLLNYARAKIDKKLCCNKKYTEPVILPSDYYFHLGEDLFFSTFDEYQKFYTQSGKYKKGAPNIALLSGNINLQNSNIEHMSAIINSLEAKGFNVYPINSFGFKKLDMIKAINPNLIINRPHGRLVMGGAKRGTEMLKALNVPILAPITVSELYSDWMDNKQGMKSGGYASMSVVLPELDGAIVPFAVAAQFEQNGRNIFDAIPVHTEKFCSMVAKFLALQTKINAEKKIAIYYYKGFGKGAMGASGIEGVQSLFNTLEMLKENGYNLDGLPENAAALEEMIQKQGSVLGPYALGAYDEFLKNGNPALVDVETYDKWASEIIPEKLRKAMEASYGNAPGDYMAVRKDGKAYIAVARIRFGNVTILPQPMPVVGDDVEAITHGVEGAPAYPYVASYLWTRKKFKADALIHFGTHGNIEFIPGKQIALSENDWTDLLIGDIPHFYPYIIDNIGEGVIAKRRSYATLVTHLTAPFMKSELYNDLEMLKDRVHKMEQMEEGVLKQNYRKTIAKMAQQQNILSAVGIDTTLETLNDEQIEKVHIYLAEIDGAKVNDGLYTLGEYYSEENLNNTARLMSIDPIRYALAEIDIAKGIIQKKDLDNMAFIAHRYNKKTEDIINRALRGEDVEKIYASTLPQEQREMLEKAMADEKAQRQKRAEMMKMMMQTREQKDSLPQFLDENGEIIAADSSQTKKKMSIKDMVSAAKSKGFSMSEMMKMHSKKGRMHKNDSSKHKKMPSMMSRMTQAKPVGINNADVDSNKILIGSIRKLKEAIYSINTHKKNLKQSTQEEQLSLINALNGRYVKPSTGGDPIINPMAVPSGRNFYSINPENTPSDEAWKVGKRLAENLLVAEMEKNGKYPEKVSFTLWSTNFISSEGATIAQILYLLGVEPLRDGFGYIRSLRLIPQKELGRPRIDVVVQTSGQLRDIAASRLELINNAVEMAANANDDEEENYVAKGFQDAENLLLSKGFSPVDARKYSKERIFGGVNGNYGTGIMGMVEKGDSWESQDEIAEQYIKNMSAMYSANGGDTWGELRAGVFEAALLNTTVVVQPRSSNTWGPLSLDHVYEFMGGLSAAVQKVTGNDPTAYFSDYRNSNRARIQGLKEAIGVESNSTLFNPKYISEMMKGEESSMEYFAETLRNTYGWNSMKPSAIDQYIWNKCYDVYILDEYKLNIEEKFTQKNPYALEEITAVMLESARKGMWKASNVQLKTLADLHTKLVNQHEAACSGFVCDNAKLRKFIAENVEPKIADEYNKNIDKARQVEMTEQEKQDNLVLKKEEQTKQKNKEYSTNADPESNRSVYIIIGVLLLALLLWIVSKRKK